jgi:formylglycine-generating enzyme required for sulfatase activity
MRYAPAATFPTGMDDDGEATVKHGFWIGETEVTYELWYEVRVWAEAKGYRFRNAGREGGQLEKIGQVSSENKKHPVTTIKTGTMQ